LDSNPQLLMFYVTHDGGKSGREEHPFRANAMFVSQKGKDVATLQSVPIVPPLLCGSFFDSKHWLVYIYNTVLTEMEANVRGR